MDEFVALNVRGTANVLDAAGRTGARALRASELGRRLRLRGPARRRTRRRRCARSAFPTSTRSPPPTGVARRRGAVVDPARRRLRPGLGALDGAAARARPRGPARDPGARRRRGCSRSTSTTWSRPTLLGALEGASRPGLRGVERRGRQLPRVLRPRSSRPRRWPLPAPAPGAAARRQRWRAPRLPGRAE